MSAADHVFGAGHRLHPVTKMPLESGRGRLDDKRQGYLHLNVIHREHGHEAAERMRAALDEFYAPPKPVVEEVAETKEGEETNG